MNPGKLLTWVIGMLLIALQSQAEVTKWIDDQGRTHYSERPPAGVKSSSLRGTVSVADGITMVPGNSASGVGVPATTTIASPRKGEVWIYTTPTCGYCRRAEEHMRLKGIPFTQKDITQDQRNQAEFRALGGRGVPVTLSGSRRINGYREEAFEAFLKAAGFS